MDKAPLPERLLASISGFFSESSPLSGSASAAQAIPPVKETQDRVEPKHPRAGIAHDLLYLFAALALVTMDRAFRARRLVLAEAAPFQADGGIRQQPLAFRTKVTRAPVAVAAITADHGDEGFPLPPDARGGPGPRL